MVDCVWLVSSNKRFVIVFKNVKLDLLNIPLTSTVATWSQEEMLCFLLTCVMTIIIQHCRDFQAWNIGVTAPILDLKVCLHTLGINKGV